MDLAGSRWISLDLGFAMDLAGSCWISLVLAGSEQYHLTRVQEIVKKVLHMDQNCNIWIKKRETSEIFGDFCLNFNHKTEKVFMIF